MRSCLRRPEAPGRSSVRAMRVSSVMFFSFSSAMVMFTYGDFLSKGGSEESRTARRAGGALRSELMQLASAPLRKFPAQTLLPGGSNPRSYSGRYSLSLGCAYSADGTFGLPWRQAGTAYTGYAWYVKLRKRDQNACLVLLFACRLLQLA